MSAWQKWSRKQQTALSTFICSKLTIKTVEQGVRYVQKEQNRHQNDANDVFLLSLMLTLNWRCSGFFSVNFEYT